MEKQSLSELIRKWRTGEATPSEIAQLEARWQEALQDEHYLQSLSKEEQEALKAGIYQNILQNIQQHEAANPTLTEAKRVAKTIPLTPSKVYWQVAASVTLLVAVSAFLFRLATRDTILTAKTAYGVRKEITLPDQSVVVLNGNSSISYAAEWNEGQPREVWLEGEAYFSVQHTAGHQSFIVYMPDQLQVEVLGTKFNVHNRRGATEVVLQEGEVKVSDEAQVYMMKPGDMVRHSTLKPQFTTRRVNPKVATAWKDNLLIFKDQSILSIVEHLSDSHGIKVEFRNEDIKNELFNGSVPADSVELFFTKLQKIYSVEVARENGVYVLQR